MTCCCHRRMTKVDYTRLRAAMTAPQEWPRTQAVGSVGGGAVSDYLADRAFQRVFGAYAPALHLGVGLGYRLEGPGDPVGVPAAQLLADPVDLPRRRAYLGR